MNAQTESIDDLTTASVASVNTLHDIEADLSTYCTNPLYAHPCAELVRAHEASQRAIGNVQELVDAMQLLRDRLTGKPHRADPIEEKPVPLREDDDADQLPDYIPF